MPRKKRKVVKKATIISVEKLDAERLRILASVEVEGAPEPPALLTAADPVEVVLDPPVESAWHKWWEGLWK
jgi:hypothetical protein